MTEIFNKVSQTKKRKILRNNSTQAEVLLWSELRRSQLGGYKFRRQCSIDGFVVDFYCPRKRLAIEIDGESHFDNEAVEYDKGRQEFIESLGVQVLRFTNEELYKELSKVLAIVKANLNGGFPPPYEGGGKGVVRRG